MMQNRQFLRALFFFAVLLCGAGIAAAQTLARPNWAGSGLSSEAWWRNAVFYRIAPANFQDSNGDGEGDLRGVAQRLDYVQSLGADAVVLESPADDDGFDELLEEAGRRHVRLLVTVDGSDGKNLLPRARQWLTRGAAGVWFRSAPGEPPSQLETEVHALRALTGSFPGGRVLVEDTSHDPSVVPAAGAELVVRALSIGTLGQGDDASLLQVQIRNAQSVPQGSVPLLLLREETQAKPGVGGDHLDELRKIAMTSLFASRAAVVIEAGQEIGIPTAAEGPRKIMQWTPSNITRAPAPVVQKPKTPAPREDVYSAFVPYVPPAKETPKPGPDFDAAPGFTSGKLPGGVAVSAANAAAEDADPASLLSFVRRLAQLHHGNPALRSGTLEILDHEKDGVLVLLRRPPAGDRAASTVILGCNLTGARVTVSLKADLAKLRVRGGYLRPLLTSPPSEFHIPQSTDSLVLAPWGVVMAEVELE